MSAEKNAALTAPTQERQELFTVYGTVQLQGFDLVNGQLDTLIEKASKLAILLDKTSQH